MVPRLKKHRCRCPLITHANIHGLCTKPGQSLFILSKLQHVATPVPLSLLIGPIWHEWHGGSWITLLLFDGMLIQMLMKITKATWNQWREPFCRIKSINHWTCPCAQHTKSIIKQTLPLTTTGLLCQPTFPRREPRENPVLTGFLNMIRNKLRDA